MTKIIQIFNKPIAQFFIIVLLAGIGMFGKLGVVELQPLGSAAHASISREIVRTNDWLTLHWPHCDEFRDFYQFPPLFFWCQAICYKIFGISDTTSKFASSFFGFLTIIATFYLGKLLSNNYTGFLSALTLILTPYFFRHSRKCEVETILVFFILLGFIFFVLSEKKNNKKFLLLSGIATGLAFLSKGPPAFAVPFSIFIYYLLTKQHKNIGDRYFIFSIVLSITVPFLWIIPQIIYKGNAFYQKFILNQILWKLSGGDRPATSFLEKIANYTFFFRAFFSYYLPWSVTGLFGIYKIYKQKIANLYILIIWVIVVWIGFSIPGYKDDYYLLALLPGWAVINGFIFKHWTEKIQQNITFSFAVIATGLLFAVIFTPIKFDKIRNPEFKIMAPYVKSVIPENEKIIIYDLYYWDMIALFPWYMDRGVTQPIKTVEELNQTFFVKEKKFIFLKTDDLNNFPEEVKTKIYPLITCGRFTLASNKK